MTKEQSKPEPQNTKQKPENAYDKSGKKLETPEAFHDAFRRRNLVIKL